MAPWCHSWECSWGRGGIGEIVEGTVDQEELGLNVCEQLCLSGYATQLVCEQLCVSKCLLVVVFEQLCVSSCVLVVVGEQLCVSNCVCVCVCQGELGTF